jgi:predicted DsbA family dithiol-disulfide isomerase
MRSRFGADVTWLPFDLHPEYPPEGIPRQQLIDRYGPAMTGQVGGMFERVGLTYNPNPDVVPNSGRALRLAELARDQGLHGPMHERLMDAYWAEARDIGDPETLRELAADVGLANVDPVLDGDAYEERVRASTAEAQSVGIHAIPAFVLDSKLLVLGAQPRDVFEQAFQQLES